MLEQNISDQKFAPSFGLYQITLEFYYLVKV